MTVRLKTQRANEITELLPHRAGHLPRSLKNDGQKDIKLQEAGAPARMRRFCFVQEEGVSELQLADGQIYYLRVALLCP